MAKFFELPPASENAAPLYLEAFFEFGTQLKEFFPPDVLERSGEIADRARRADKVFFAWENDPASVDRASIDVILDEFKDGFRKLDLAQQRPRCVFATSLDYDLDFVHVLPARCAARAWLLRASRSLDRDDFDAAIGDLGKILRLSRDLRPRSVPNGQICSIAIDSTTARDGIGLVLAHPKLKVEHCDRLIKLLADHEAQAIDPFLQAIEAEFLTTRLLLRIFAERIKTTGGADGRPIETPLDQGGLVRELNRLARTILIRQFVEGVVANTDAERKTVASPVGPDDTTLDIQAFVNLMTQRGDPVPDKQVREILDKLAKLSEKEVGPAVERTRSLLAAKPGYCERIRVLEACNAKNSDRRASKLFEGVATQVRPFIESVERDRVYMGATKCLVALRRQQLTHATTSTDLAEVCREAGMSGIPVDPFSGSPLKLVIIDGEPVVYSIGSDGVDDGGLKDARQGLKPTGDFLYRMSRTK